MKNKLFGILAIGILAFGSSDAMFNKRRVNPNTNANANGRTQKIQNVAPELTSDQTGAAANGNAVAEQAVQGNTNQATFINTPTLKKLDSEMTLAGCYTSKEIWAVKLVEFYNTVAALPGDDESARTVGLICAEPVAAFLCACRKCAAANKRYLEAMAKHVKMQSTQYWSTLTIQQREPYIAKSEKRISDARIVVDESLKEAETARDEALNAAIDAESQGLEGLGKKTQEAVVYYIIPHLDELDADTGVQGNE